MLVEALGEVLHVVPVVGFRYVRSQGIADGVYPVEVQATVKSFSLTTIQDYNTLKPQIAFSCRGSLQVYPLTPGGVIPGRV